MNEYDLPLLKKCTTCFGEGVVWIISVRSFAKHCEACDGKGTTDLPILELDS